MGGSPLLHPLHVLRAAEMISVFGFAQPTLLPGALAGLLTLRNRTILLASSIPVIGHKQHLAMQTLATARFGLHQVEAASVKSPARRPQVRRRSAQEENGKRREEEVLSVNGEEDGTGRRPHFQTARITPFSDRR
jgi:hypothetical protein